MNLPYHWYMAIAAVTLLAYLHSDQQLARQLVYHPMAHTSLLLPLVRQARIRNDLLANNGYNSPSEDERIVRATRILNQLIIPDSHGDLVMRTSFVECLDRRTNQLSFDVREKLGQVRWLGRVVLELRVPSDNTLGNFYHTWEEGMAALSRLEIQLLEAVPR